MLASWLDFFCIEWKKFWKDKILFSLFCWRIALKVDQNVKSIFDHMFCIKEEKLSRDGIHQAHSKVIAKNYDSNFVMMLRSCLRDWIVGLGLCWGLSSFSLFVSVVYSLVAPIYRLCACLWHLTQRTFHIRYSWGLFVIHIIVEPMCALCVLVWITLVCGTLHTEPYIYVSKIQLVWISYYYFWLFLNFSGCLKLVVVPWLLKIEFKQLLDLG